jgi:hypothetical protein
MEEDNKSSISTSTQRGKALDKHCFAINTITDVECTGKKHSGNHYGKHKKDSNHDKDTKDFKACDGENCQSCLIFKGKYLLRTKLPLWALSSHFGH